MNEQHRKNFRISWLIAIMSIVLFSVVLIWGYAAINEPSPLQNTNRRLLSTVVERGDEITVVSAYDAQKSCSGFFSRSIYDKNGLRIMSESEYRPAMLLKTGERIPMERSFRIPDNAALGPARYVAIVEWSCNALQRLWPQVEKLPELEFTIIGKNHAGL